MAAKDALLNGVVDQSGHAKNASPGKSLEKLVLNMQELSGVEATSATGEVAVADLKATGVVLVGAAEALGANLVFSHVVVADGKFTVYTMDTSSQAVAVLNAKSVHWVALKPE